MSGVLLFKMRPYRSEGALAYLLRWAESNGLGLKDLEELGITFCAETLYRHGLLPEREADPDLWGWVSTIDRLRSATLRMWNIRYARFCPACLRDSDQWPAEWELCYYDACMRHQIWMVDRCSSCSKPISWKRNHRLRCSCGSDFRLEVESDAPSDVVALSSALSLKIRGRHDEHGMAPPLRGLSVDQSQRLIRFFGAHLDPAGTRKNLKVQNVARMDVSWPITSVAAAVLADWPIALHARLSAIQQESADVKQGLSRTFKRF